MKRKIKTSRIVLVLILLGIFTYAYFVGVECVYLKYFHIICPGCGMTRAVRELMHLNLSGAFTYHPMVFSLPVILLYILADGKLFNRKFIDNTILIMIGVGFVINYVIKLMNFLT